MDLDPEEHPPARHSVLAQPSQVTISRGKQLVTPRLVETLNVRHMGQETLPSATAGSVKCTIHDSSAVLASHIPFCMIPGTQKHGNDFLFFLVHCVVISLALFMYTNGASQ